MTTDDATKFKIGDRVKKVGEPGPLGTVNKVRVETVRTTVRSSTDEPPGVSVTILWDNGTLSHFVPDGIEKV